MKTYSLYSDGNYFPRAKKSGFGGYIEAPDGQTLVEYTEQIRQNEYAHNFELLGIIRGLQIARSMDIERIVSYCDDKTTSLRLQEIFSKDGDVSFLPANAKPELFQEIVDLSRTFKSARFQYIPRSQNKHSDALSRRYATLMEQNFIKQYDTDLDHAEAQFETTGHSLKRIFFSHPRLVRMQEKNNPFLVSQHRNRKVRKITKGELQHNYQHLFIEVLKHSESTVLFKGFFYNEKKEKILLNEHYSHAQSEHLHDFCEFFAQCSRQIAQQYPGENCLWVSSNSRHYNPYFEQKEKIPKHHFESFAKVHEAFNAFERVVYHALPFEHNFSPEIAVQEKSKETLYEDIQTIDNLIEQMQKGMERNHNRYFGRLISHQLKNYQTLLQRELNDMEKNQIIEETTAHLEAKGVMVARKKY